MNRKVHNPEVGKRQRLECRLRCVRSQKKLFRSAYQIADAGYLLAASWQVWKCDAVHIEEIRETLFICIDTGVRGNGRATRIGHVAHPEKTRNRSGRVLRSTK